MYLTGCKRRIKSFPDPKPSFAIKVPTSLRTVTIPLEIVEIMKIAPLPTGLAMSANKNLIVNGSYCN